MRDGFGAVTGGSILDSTGEGGGGKDSTLARRRICFSTIVDSVLFLSAEALLSSVVTAISPSATDD